MTKKATKYFRGKLPRAVQLVRGLGACGLPKMLLERPGISAKTAWEAADSEEREWLLEELGATEYGSSEIETLPSTKELRDCVKRGFPKFTRDQQSRLVNIIESDYGGDFDTKPTWEQVEKALRKWYAYPQNQKKVKEADEEAARSLIDALNNR